METICSASQNDRFAVITWHKFEEDAKILARSINKHGKFRYIYGIPRGGLVVATVLSHLLETPLKTHLNEDFSDALVVDDVSDSGLTLKRFDGYRTATLYRKDKTITEPDFFVETINEWIVFPWETKTTSKVDYKEIK